MFLIVLVSFALADEHTGIIRGRVLPAESNATVYAAYTGLETPYSVRIDSKGEYSLEVPMAVYTLLIVGEGNYINRSLWNIGVREDTTTELEDVTLAKIGETGSVSGYVDPVVEGIVVWIKEAGESEPAGFSSIDADGYYEITDLKPGTYGVSVQFDRTQNFYDYRGRNIEVIANESSSGVNLIFTPKTSKYLIDRIIVKFLDGVSEAEKKEIISSYGCFLMSSSFRRIYVVGIPKDRTVDEMVRLFKTNPNVKDAYSESFLALAVEEDKKGRPESTHDSPASLDLLTIEENETEQDVIKNVSSPEVVQRVESIDTKLIKEEKTSFISRLILFFKSLFGLK